jgi:hypothetical protein
MTTRTIPALLCLALTITSLTFVACSDENESDQLGVGAQCASTEDCKNDDAPELTCLTNFKGGYCGIASCTKDADCPDASACVAHDDGKNYCFRLCSAKADCNANRDASSESNCSSSITFVEGKTSSKACVPPSAS